MSKAGCNLLSRKIHAEHENLNVFAVHPGWLKTDMGDWAAKHAHVEMDGAPTTLEEGVQGVIKLVDEATRETTSGGFWNHDGEKLPR